MNSNGLGLTPGFYIEWFMGPIFQKTAEFDFWLNIAKEPVLKSIHHIPKEYRKAVIREYKRWKEPK